MGQRGKCDCYGMLQWCHYLLKYGSTSHGSKEHCSDASFLCVGGGTPLASFELFLVCDGGQQRFEEHLVRFCQHLARNSWY